MYTCGPTVYNYAHIGNLRAFVFEDLLRRYLEYKGYEVKHVMNITDVEDKIIRTVRETGKSLQEVTDFYTQEFFRDLDTLNIKRAHIIPRATETIPDMIALIEKLIAPEARLRRRGWLGLFLDQIVQGLRQAVAPQSRRPPSSARASSTTSTTRNTWPTSRSGRRGTRRMAT